MKSRSTKNLPTLENEHHKESFAVPPVHGFVRLRLAQQVQMGRNGRGEGTCDALQSDSPRSLESVKITRQGKNRQPRRINEE